jgi:hypothetical protein
MSSDCLGVEEAVGRRLRRGLHGFHTVLLTFHTFLLRKEIDDDTFGIDLVEQVFRRVSSLGSDVSAALHELH